jgi:hypothetical protein
LPHCRKRLVEQQYLDVLLPDRQSDRDGLPLTAGQLRHWGVDGRNVYPDGLYRPLRIFTSVDLPAPLSPTSPRTSLRRTRKLTFRSATTGLKLIVICSVRSTSSTPVRLFSPTFGVMTHLSLSQSREVREDRADGAAE